MVVRKDKTTGEKIGWANKINKLLEAASKMENCHTEQELYDFVVEITDDILNFDLSGIVIVENDKFKIKSLSGDIPPNLQKEVNLNNGVNSYVYKNGEPLIIDNISEFKEAAPRNDEYRSGLNVPIKNRGVFQALSKEKNGFTQEDLKAIELLISHLQEALKRIDYEKQLKNSKEMYKLVTENSYDMISLLDKESKPRFINKAHKRILGYDEEDLLGKPALKLFHPDDRDKAERKWNEIIKKRKDRDVIEGRFKSKSGEYRWMKSHIKIINDGDGGIDNILVVSRDITQRKKAQNELKENKKKVEKLHEVASQLETCRTEEEIYDNIIDAAERILDFDYISIIKKENEKLKVKAVSFEIPPELSREISDKENYTWLTYKSGKSILVKDITKDNQAKANMIEYKSGISIPIGDYGVFQALSKNIGGYNNKDLEMAELLISHMKEAIKRMKYDEKLKKSEKKYRSIFENTGNATVIINEDTTISLANEKFENLTGYSKEEIENRMSWKEFIVREDIKRLNRYHHIRRSDPNSAPMQYETQLITKYGDTRDVLISVGVLSDTKQSIASILDITMSKKNIEALRDSQEAFRISFDKSLIGMAMIDKNLNFLDVNEKLCNMLDLKEDELITINLEDLLIGEKRDAVIGDIQNIFDGGKNKTKKNVKLKTKNNKNINYIINVHPIKIQENKTNYSIVQIMNENKT